MAGIVIAARTARAAWSLRRPLAIAVTGLCVIGLLPLLFVGFATIAVAGAQLQCATEDTDPAAATRADVERAARRRGVQPIGAALIGALHDAALRAHPTASITAAGPFRLPADMAAGSSTSSGRWRGPQDPNGPLASVDSRNHVPAATRTVLRALTVTDPSAWTRLRDAALTADPDQIDTLTQLATDLFARAMPHAPLTADTVREAISRAGDIDAGAYGDLVTGGVLILGDPARIPGLAARIGSRAFGGTVTTRSTSADPGRALDGATRDLAAQQGLVLILTNTPPDPVTLRDAQDATGADIRWITLTGPDDPASGVVTDPSSDYVTTLRGLEQLAGASTPGVLCASSLQREPIPDPTQITAPDPAAAAAIAYAYAQVGEPYVPNGAARPPDTWDCSKLTAAAWGSVGITLTPYSYAQYDEVQPIPEHAVAPGDLIFWFARGAHHVAIVDTVTDGRITFVEAANPSRGVVRSALTDGWYRDHLTGFGRVTRPPVRT